MIATKLIQDVVMLERKLKIEEEQRRDRRAESYGDLPTTPQPSQKKHESIFARFFRLRKQQQPDCQSC